MEQWLYMQTLKIFLNTFAHKTEENYSIANIQSFYFFLQ